jgi:hypothetical protein
MWDALERRLLLKYLLNNYPKKEFTGIDVDEKSMKNW